jgi:hypothetical protein
MKIVKDKIEIKCLKYTPNREIFCIKTLTRERWFKLSFDEQMANVGADVGRAINWREKDMWRSGGAFETSLELLDLTIDDEKNKEKFEELFNVRKDLVDYFISGSVDKLIDEKWNSYFYAFNYAARINN